MDITIENYLNEEEIKEICKNALYQKIRDDMRNLNVNDIISNISYSEVAVMVDTYIGENNYCQSAIAKRVIDIIENLSSYSVFRKADAWDRQESIGHKILNEEVAKSRPLIKERIEQIVKEYDFPELSRNEIMFTLADTLTGLFFNEDK